jgi:hypothetical protein
MRRVLAAVPTEFLEFEPLRRLLLILVSHVIAVLALTALQHNIVSWHIWSVVSC